MGRRIRTVKPEFFTNEDVQSVPAEVRYTLIGLFFYADDYGRAPANLALMRSSVFPLDAGLTLDTLEEHLLALAEAQHPLIRLYDVDGRSYLEVADWAYWQRIDRPTDSRLPAPPSRVLASPREPSHPEVKVLVGEGSEAGGGVEQEEERQEEAHSRATPAQSAPLGTHGMPPSLYCSKHDARNEKPCWQCKTAREKAEEWEANQYLTPAVVFVESPAVEPLDMDDPNWVDE